MKSVKFLLVLFFLSIISTQIYSLPRFALRYLDKCSSCHFNPTGGEMRNENGFVFGKNVMSMISPRDDKFPISPKLSDNVSFGFDYRSQFLYSQEKKRTDFQDMTGSVYLNAAVSDKIDVTARYDFIWSIWEGYGTARILPNGSYIKIGSFSPNFGIKLDDHTSYTRGGDYGLLFSTGAIRGLIYNPLYLETGIEVGANLSDIINLTASVGKSRSNSTFAADPTWTTRLELSPSINKVGLLLGASYTSTKTKSFNQVTGSVSNLPTQLYGGFAGIGYKQFTLMGEFDIATDYISSGGRSSAMMIEAAYQVLVGLEAVIRYDRFDPDTNKNKDERAHLVLGFEFYPYSFVEVRPQYRINLEDPSIDNDAFVLQFHFWY
ncbi:MAG: hypothetical protein CVV24_09535 [Ignavibacteriae bacterium HGW-Ignavibacteriae-3]|nr:MAG: hypothetical protein CVV24_09535 [Ignavibacteriae bacterium HGW-Ignavibacteriae-3]